MHEMSLTRDAVKVVLESSQQAHARKVKSVQFTIGEGRDVVEPLFCKYFQYLARDTIAQDAQIVVNHTPLQLRCRECGCVYPVDARVESTWPCPGCGKMDYELHSGMEFTIDKIEVV